MIRGKVRAKGTGRFPSGKVRALIATDVAARGIDIKQLEQVVNRDMPFKAKITFTVLVVQAAQATAV